MHRFTTKIKQFGKHTNMNVTVKKNNDGKWVINNRNSVLSRYRLNSAKLKIKNVNKTVPTVHYDEWTPSQINNLPMLRYK